MDASIHYTGLPVHVKGKTGRRRVSPRVGGAETKMEAACCSTARKKGRMGIRIRYGVLPAAIPRDGLHVDIWTTALISLFLLAGAILLMVSHVRSWRAFQLQEHDTAALLFRRRQLRRRMQSSSLLGLLAVMLFAGELINARVESQGFKLVYWSGVILVVVWMGLSAVADILATKLYYGRLRNAYLIEQAKLRAELRRLRAKEGNGEVKDE